MTQVDFYHLTQSDLETALVLLLKKTIAAGKTALILCPKPAATALDAALWTHEAESWIPHGVDDAEGVDVASVWISTDPARNPIDAPFLFLVHGQTPPTLE
ncbi:MAG: DNA polymerase III subunit chi, partial [Candidatus Puniceispirillaceae bacterium]